MDTKATLEFLETLSKQAFESKDAELMHRIGANPALSFYFTNVHSLKATTPELFAQNYPQYMKMAESIREEYVQLAESREHGNQIKTLESKLDTLSAQLQAFLEAQGAAKKPVKALKEDEVPTPKPAPTPAPTDDEEDETDAEDTAKTEA